MKFCIAVFIVFFLSVVHAAEIYIDDKSPSVFSASFSHAGMLSNLKFYYLEWYLFRRVYPLDSEQARFERLEKHVFNRTYEEKGFSWRISNLLHDVQGSLFFERPALLFKSATVSKGYLLKVRIDARISTRTHRAGQVFTFSLAENVYEKGCLIFPKGCFGRGVITWAEPEDSFNRNAVITADILYFADMTARRIKLEISDEAALKNREELCVIGRFKPLFSDASAEKEQKNIWQDGSPVTIEEGTEFFVSVGETVTVESIYTEIY